MIEFREIHKQFGELQVLRDLNLEISPQKITAILGPNSSGKTTLIKCALGMVLPNRGRIIFQGKDIIGQWRYREHFNYLPQAAAFPNNLTTRELLQMVKDLRSDPSQEDALVERFDLSPFLDKRLSTLSGGTKQKINIVLALMRDCPLIILDEPTTGLDPVSLIHFKELLAEEKSRGKTIVLTTHIMGLVEEIADDIVFLLEGMIHFQGTLKKILADTGEPNLERAIAAMLQN